MPGNGSTRPMTKPPTKAEPLPERVEDAIRRFLVDGRNGSVTLHVADGRVQKIEVREVTRGQ